MSKAIFVIDIWKTHFCVYANTFITKNIKKINRFIQKCREQKYLIIFLNTDDNVKSNYNKYYEGEINDKKSMKPPFSANICYCSIDIPCYFKLHKPINKKIHKQMYEHIMNGNINKKWHLKKYTKDLEKQGFVENNTDLYIDDSFHPKLIIKKKHDYLIDDKVEILISLLKEKNIKDVFYLGEAINLCMSQSRNISANRLITNNINCYIIEDLSADFGYVGFDFENKIIDPNIDHNYCHNKIKEYIESYGIKYVSSNYILDNLN